MRFGNKPWNKYQNLIFLYPSSHLLPTLKQYLSVPFQFTYHLLFLLPPLLPPWSMAPSHSPGLLQNDPPAPGIPCSPLVSYSAPTTLASVMFPGHADMLLPQCICLLCFLWHVFASDICTPHPFSSDLYSNISLPNKQIKTQKKQPGHYSKLKIPFYFISPLPYHYLTYSIFKQLYILLISSLSNPLLFV